MNRLRSLMIVAVIGLAGCSGIETIKLTNQKFPPTSADSVRVYTVPPTQPYTEIAILKSDKYDADEEAKLLEKMKKDAAELGADGLIITGASQTGRSDRSDMDYRVTAIKFNTTATTPPPATK